MTTQWPFDDLMISGTELVLRPVRDADIADFVAIFPSLPMSTSTRAAPHSEECRRPRIASGTVSPLAYKPSSADPRQVGGNPRYHHHDRQRLCTVSCFLRTFLTRLLGHIKLLRAVDGFSGTARADILVDRISRL